MQRESITRNRQGSGSQKLEPPADEAKTVEAAEHTEKLIQVYTDGSKNQQGVGTGVALYI